MFAGEEGADKANPFDDLLIPCGPIHPFLLLMSDLSTRSDFPLLHQLKISKAASCWDFLLSPVRYSGTARVESVPQKTNVSIFQGIP